jgi:aminoglycoside 6'-N-acetyltransferase
VRDSEIELRTFRAGDDEGLQRILAEPEVKRWWPVPDYVRDAGWIVLVDSRTAGWVEFHEESNPWYPSVAFDIAITSSLHGRGYGRRILRLVIDRFAAAGHHRFTLDPNVENARAIRCYESLGFRRVGVMRCYERSAAGGWNDGLLMELILERNL